MHRSRGDYSRLRAAKEQLVNLCMSLLSQGGDMVSRTHLYSSSSRLRARRWSLVALMLSTAISLSPE